MTTYVTKVEDQKTHHFRATVDKNVVDIVHGVFYNWLGKSFEGCGDNASAVKRQQELIEEKLNEGFQVTPFKESLENTLDVYDKAKWHFGGDFPEELDHFQGYVHTGMFLGWLIENDLISGQFRTDHEEEIRKFKLRELTGAQIFERCCDGVLLLDDINEKGNRFALPYFNFETGLFLADYHNTLCETLPSAYHVADNWENYFKLKKVLDGRYLEWSSSN